MSEILQLQQYQQKPVKSNKQLFRNAFIHSGGLPVVLHILIAILVDSNCIIDSTALAVALHIIHFLLTSSGGAVLGARCPRRHLAAHRILHNLVPVAAGPAGSYETQ